MAEAIVPSTQCGSCPVLIVTIALIILLEFNDSRTVSQARLPRIIQATFSSLASKQSETSLNTLVLVGHGIQGDLCRLKELGVGELLPT